MINKIAHIADYHIDNTKWHDRYRISNEYIYQKLREESPDRILIQGDLYENYIIISNESEILAAEFLNNLSNIAPIIITLGNHDLAKKSKNKINSIHTLISLMNNPRISFFEYSGFYEDDNVVWVVHSHLEKNINPWIDIKHKRDKNKIYIDLWHDPINGCIADNGFKMTSKSYRNLSDFKGNFGMFGDIHKFQYLNDDKTFAFPSSTFQQTFGESVDNHGFIIWDINNKTSEFIEVPDEYKLITFRTDENFDYDDINFDHSLATKNSEFRVIWRDYSSNINNENEEKIKNYISDKWNSKITFEKDRIYSNISSSQKLTESININDKQVQQDIFKEYLISNKYDDSFIDEILKIDDIIDSRIEIVKTINNIEWSIDRLWCDNFKSYDKLELNWADVHGIIQIGGQNQNGKSTILDLITYVSHGTTLSTNKLGGAQREKFGDNRYINNKRNLDYCEGGMTINVNGEKYTLVRRTERTWDKSKKNITSVPTNIEYYSGVEINEDNKLRGERKSDTQKMLDAIIGDFDDFIRLTLTNSENLNHLISLDRATFIDSVIRDAGFDIFEKKLSEFKEYKKEINTSRIDINLKESEEKVKTLKELLKEYKSNHDEIKKSVDNVDEQIKVINKDRDSKIKRLHKIDSDIASIDVNSVNDKIEEYKTAIENNLTQQKTNFNKLKGLKTEYDVERYESLLKQIKTIEDEILNLKLKIYPEENKIEKEKSNILRVDDKVKQLKQKEIDSQKSKLIIINNDIEKISNELELAIDEKKRYFLDQKKNHEFDVKTITTKINNIRDKGVDIKKQIKLLEESKVCPTCKREYDPEHQEHNDNVKELNNDINNLLDEVKIYQEELKESTTLVNNLQIEIDNLDDNIYPEDILIIQKNIQSKLNEKNNEINQINDICEEIRQNNFVNVPELEKNINMGLKLKTTSEENIIIFESNIKTINRDIKDKEIEKGEYQNFVFIIEKDKDEVKIYETLNQDNKELSLKIENIKLTIENVKVKIDKYYDQLKFIEENKIIDNDIILLDDNISNLNDEKESLNENIANLIKDATITKSDIESLQNNIKTYIEQVKKEEILKEYSKCVDRNGIPSFLLQKYRSLINIELEDMLTNVDFNIFFDDYLNLKMYMKNSPNAIINSLESSGMERTFTALALKFTLRNINNKSIPSVLFLDEVMGKLKGESVDKFNKLLTILKTKIDKILIIEHTHNIDYDMFVSVEKDKYGVSSLTIEE